jgi:hypothetical protein
MMSVRAVSRFTGFEFWKRSFLDIYQYIKADKIFYGVMISFSVVVIAILQIYGYESKGQLTAYLSMLPTMLKLSLIIGTLWYFITLVYRRERRPLYCFWQQVVFIYDHRNRIIASFLLFVGVSAFLSYCSTFKGMIPLLHPFEFDEAIHNIDLWLFFGKEPWQLIHGLYDSPWITFGLDLSYNIWFFLVYAILGVFILTQKVHRRRQYILTWLLCWIVIGNILAFAFSSVGPTFVGRLFPINTDYLPLMTLLHQQDMWLQQYNPKILLWSLNTQDYLWTSYTTGKEMLGSGISAMPSMHVSMAVLMALGVSSLNRKLGILFWLFALVIYVGSFTLGWHYAVDGLVSGPVTLIIWRLCGSKYLTK